MTNADKVVIMSNMNQIKKVHFVREGLTHIVFENQVTVSVATSNYSGAELGDDGKLAKVEVAVFCEDYEFVGLCSYDDVVILDQTELNTLLDRLKNIDTSKNAELTTILQGTL